VVVANLPPDTLKAMGLDYGSLTAIKPDIILTTVSAFGHGGPYSDRVGFDGIGQVMSGPVYLGGDPDQPRRFPAPYVDFGTALGCTVGTLLALIERGKTGKGQMVEGALLKTALTINNATLIEQAVIEANRVPTGNLGQTSAPSDLYQTKDGWILAQVVGNPLYERWAKLMGEEEWLTDPRFKDDISRGNNGAIISERMAAWCAERTTAEAIETLGAARIPSGPVYTPQQALDDPHVNAMGWFRKLDYPGMPKPAPVVETQFNLSASPGAVERRAPQLGEHTDEVMESLGYDAERRAELRTARVI
jgi:crotonobetainyl-CoA:carnitine CoA-transferase CaiB-like acyl-CoA transferase